MRLCLVLCCLDLVRTWWNERSCRVPTVSLHQVASLQLCDVALRKANLTLPLYMTHQVLTRPSLSIPIRHLRQQHSTRRLRTQPIQLRSSSTSALIVTSLRKVTYLPTYRNSCSKRSVTRLTSTWLPQRLSVSTSQGLPRTATRRHSWRPPCDRYAAREWLTGTLRSRRTPALHTVTVSQRR